MIELKIIGSFLLIFCFAVLFLHLLYFPVVDWFAARASGDIKHPFPVQRISIVFILGAFLLWLSYNV